MSAEKKSQVASGEIETISTVQRGGLRKTVAFLVSVSIGVVLIVLLLSQIDPVEIIAVFSRSDLRWVSLGGLCYAVAYLSRAARFRFLLAEGRTSIGSMYAVACVHGMLNHLLPMRSGELSYLYLTRRLLGAPVGEATVSLVVARLYDYLTVSGLFVVTSAVVLSSLEGSVNWYLGGAVLLAVLAVTFLVGAAHLSRRLERMSGRHIGARESKRSALLEWLQQKLGEMGMAFERTSRARIRTRVLLLSILLWLCTYGMFFCFLRGLGFAVASPLVVVGSTFAVFTNVLPLSGIGSFGTLEAGWTAGFMLIGFEKELAIVSGFAVHLLALGMIISFGVVGIVAILLGRKR